MVLYSVVKQHRVECVCVLCVCVCVCVCVYVCVCPPEESCMKSERAVQAEGHGDGEI